MPKLTNGELVTITNRARQIRKSAGTTTVEKFNMPWRTAVKKAAEELKITGRPLSPNAKPKSAKKPRKTAKKSTK